MRPDLSYQKALDLLRRCSTPQGFLASAQPVSNYQRVWARDGVICGLAALLSGDAALIATFKATLETLAKHQHANGTIPSNVMTGQSADQVSYGGLAGRVDAVSWFVIGVAQFAYFEQDPSFLKRYEPTIQRCLDLMEAWEFNNKHLMYVPLSGNWADEYITDGYVLYDQLLRVWALRSYNHFAGSAELGRKIEAITQQLTTNFFPNNPCEKYHPRAYEAFGFDAFLPCCFSPAGYKPQFDAFANALAVFLNIGNPAFLKGTVQWMEKLRSETILQLIPAFWPPITPHDRDWNLLKDNCKYEFRNFPYEFHNGGSWPMVNGFYGLALMGANQSDQASALLGQINKANAAADDGFYENFNTQTAAPNGVAFCAWSAAAAVMLHQYLNTNYKLLT